MATETAIFDIHGFVKRLTNAGMPEPQAEEQSRLIQERLATKQDLKLLSDARERHIKQLEVTIKAVEAGLKRDLDKKELNDLTLKSIEAIAAVHVKSIQENARASMEALKASTDIKDFETLQSYLEEQGKVAQNVSKAAMEDAQEIAKLSETYANDVKDLISKSILT